MSTLKHYLMIFLVSMVPLIELRGAIPYAIGFIEAGEPLNLTVCYSIAIVGNMLPVPFLIKFSKGILLRLSKVNKIGWIFQKIIDRGNKKAAEIGGWELLGLFLFVAIPLPGTGAWTASLVSALLQLRIKKSLLVIGIGVIVCGIIMGVLSFSVANIMA